MILSTYDKKLSKMTASSEMGAFLFHFAGYAVSCRPSSSHARTKLKCGNFVANILGEEFQT